MLIAHSRCLQCGAGSPAARTARRRGDAWVDGRATAGHQGREVKHNLQLAESSAVARELSAIVIAALERHPLFLSAALPSRIYAPMFNRYDGSSEMRFGTHVDGAVRLLPGTA
jgi:PKHD-type hydroxylase